MDAEPTFHGHTLAEAIDGLKAYDGGALDSGIKDEELRDWVVSRLGPDSPTSEAEHRATLARIARDMLADEAIEAGYGLADVAALIEWLRDNECMA